jgi:pSer/pThr/pTyr-binding forkhead associated (FHA) protein
MDEFIDVKIDVFEHTGQRARLRKTLTVSALVDEILKEFDDITADAPEKYAVYLKGNERPLAASETLTQLDIQPQDELVFDYVRQTIRKMLEPHQYATLREEATGKTYDIQWQPAIIGRPTNEVDHNIMLAVNVQSLTTGKTISRKHAQITFAEGRYYIEPLAENNPVFLGGKEVPLNTRREIKNGDKLLFGHNKVSMLFTTQKPEVLSAHVARSQPVSAPPVPASLPQPMREPVSVSPSPALPPGDVDKTYLAPEGVKIAYLFIEQTDQAGNLGQRIEILTYPYVLGRDLLALNGEIEVSRRHAEVNFNPATQTFTITDLQSRNGVLLDGALIEPNRPYEIRQGTRIGLGLKVVLRLDI